MINCNFFTEEDTVIPDLCLQRYKDISSELNLSFSGKSVCIVKLDLVDELKKRWYEEMKGITPYYAIKALPDDEIIKKMNYFDCASAQEIKQVIRCGKSPDNIIFANTAKRPVDIIYAKNEGVCLMTLDSIYEADKIINLFPECGLVLRIAVSDKGAQFTKFAHKFGSTSVEQSKEIIDKYYKNLKGFSFHVGCGQTNKDAWSDAMTLLDDLFNYILFTYPNYYNNVEIIDIGGGFNSSSLSVSLKDIRGSLDTWIKIYSNKKWIAEPGRFFCADVMTLLCPIISKNIRNSQICYVLGNSIHHTFSCIIFDLHKPRQLTKKDWKGRNTEHGSIVGETCDGVDVLYNGLVATNLNIGDILIFGKIGAYSNASANHFNGFDPPEIIYF